MSNIPANDSPDFLRTLVTGLSAPLLNASQTIGAGNFATFGPIYVGNIPNIFVEYFTSGGSTWNVQQTVLQSDSLTTVNGDSSVANMSNDVGVNGVLSVTSPWTSFTAHNTGGVSGTFNIFVLGVLGNASTPAIAGPQPMIAWDQVVASGGNTPVYASVAIAGRAVVNSFVNVAGIAGPSIEYWNGGAWIPLAQMNSTTAMQNQSTVIGVPFASVRARLFNSTAGNASLVGSLISLP